MALIDKLTAIADAIREKMNTSASLTLSAMPGLIRSIQTGSTSTTGVPDDIVTEAKRVATGILSKKTGNSITFIAMSDMHEMGDGDYSNPTIIERYRRANRNAGQAAKIISDQIKPDFFTFLGDFAWGASTTTIADGVQSIRQGREYIAEVALANKTFITSGNHDALTNSYVQNGEYLDHKIMQGLLGNYRYMDFTAKKIRVICLNTAEIEGMSVTSNGNTERMSGTQLQWFAEALDLSAKSDAAKWGIVILSHHPLDWGNIKPASNVLAAYQNGTSYSVTHGGVAVSYNYAGKNNAKVIANFHGHTHCFNVSDISGTEVKRIAIPNACYERTNEYGESGNTTFGDATSYEKVDNSTGKNTAFCVVSIDLTEKVIYADCFGAGYDRIISYGAADIITYSVTNNLSNASTSNGAATVMGGSSYFAMITAKDGYELKTVTVKMGGVDITATAYNNGVITITEVTGDIVITVTTVSNVIYDVTNLVPTSQTKDGSGVYNGVGYKNGAYPSDNGVDGTNAACVVTGWIPYNKEIIYIRGAKLDTTNNYVRIRTYYPNKSDGLYIAGSSIATYFTIETLDTNYYKLTPKDNLTPYAFYRISLVGTGENLIITHNEPIETGGSGGGGDDPGTEPVVYTNLVPTAVATDGITVFNGTGYMNGQYASAPHHYTDAACVTTGFIRLGTDVRAIYVKGAEWTASNKHCRVHLYSTLGTQSGLSHKFEGATTGIFTVETLGTNYYKFTPSRVSLVAEYWYCMSLVGTGENLIITHDEPIE